MTKVTEIYPNTMSANLTLEFGSEDGASLLLQAKNMPKNSILLIEYEYGNECSNVFEPVIWCCGQMKMTAPTNQLLLPPIPGRYRGVFVQIDDDGNILNTFDENEFLETGVQYLKVKTNGDLSEYYSACCK